MKLQDHQLRTVSRVLRATAALGLVASLVGVVAGLTLLGRAEAALDASLRLTADTLEALDASAGVATDTVDVLATSLADLRQTADALDAAVDGGEQLITGLGDLVRDDVAPAVATVEDGVGDLVSVAEGIDDALSALSSLPLGGISAPDASFADGLQQLDGALTGLSGTLQAQADLIDQTAVGLSEVGSGVAGLAADLAAFDTTLAETQALLATYDETITEGQALVADARDDLGTQLGFSRIAIVLFGLAFAAAQATPLVLSGMLDRAAADEEADQPAGRASRRRAI